MTGADNMLMIFILFAFFGLVASGKYSNQLSDRINQIEQEMAIMAYDEQYKDNTADDYRVKTFDCPKKGDMYWDRHSRKIMKAEQDMNEKFLIMVDKEMLYQVTLPYACFGIEVMGNKITDAAPVGRWMVGKSFVCVCEWIAKKNGTIEKVGE